jgi:hypothetical protein
VLRTREKHSLEVKEYKADVIPVKPKSSSMKTVRSFLAYSGYTPKLA